MERSKNYTTKDLVEKSGIALYSFSPPLFNSRPVFRPSVSRPTFQPSSGLSHDWKPKPIFEPPVLKSPYKFDSGAFLKKYASHGYLSGSIGSSETKEEEKKEESCCYVTSACLDDLGLSRDCDEMRAMKDLTKNHILKSFSGIRDYVRYGRRAPAVVEAIRSRTDSREVWQGVYGSLKEVTSKIVSGAYEAGYQAYKDLVLNLENRFIGKRGA